jgi:hypothetical protein
MFALIFLFQAVSAPPVPPPSQENYSAAIALWQDNPPLEAEKQSAIDRAVSMAASGALAEVGVRVMPTERGSAGRWIIKFDQMRSVIKRQVPSDLTKIEEDVTACVANEIAYSLSVDEIRQARTFFRTKAGKVFWHTSRAFHETLNECYRVALNLRATNADFRAVGFMPPMLARDRNAVAQ